ncbi:MAG: hypothetical protein QXG03_11145, partial [Halalkalicoccus sp.]
MVSGGELRLVGWLLEEDNSIAPTINEDNEVVYPTAARILDSQRSARETLDSLARREILEKELARKGYICPSCGLDAMRYSRACPDCDSIHTTGRVLVRHPDCGHSGPAAEFDCSGGGRRCRGCDTAVKATELNYEQRHVCLDCKSIFSEPRHRLQCRVCLETYPPKQLSERLLYTYHLTDHGRAWYHIRMMTREQARRAFEDKGYATEMDATVRDGDGTRTVDLLADHGVLDRRVVANIHDGIETTDLERLRACAEAAAAHPTIISTDRFVSKEVLREIRNREMGLLTVQRDGTLGGNHVPYGSETEV